jgi:NADH-quinone oxidoreductase subunit I
VQSLSCLKKSLLRILGQKSSPKEFEIDMIRCIYCGLCEEVCPQAIFLKKDYSITGYTREEMVHKKEKLLEMGGVMEGLVYKWNEKK